MTRTKEVIMSIKSKVMLPLVLVSAAASCGGDDKQVLVPAAEVAPRTSPQQAVDAIANERCNHEASCGAIGPGAKFQTREHCILSMRADAAKDLAGNDCRDGIADRNLAACSADIADEACSGVSSSFDRLRTHEACRTGALCLG
jgi:hypothetical protein